MVRIETDKPTADPKDKKNDHSSPKISVSSTDIAVAISPHLPQNKAGVQGSKKKMALG